MCKRFQGCPIPKFLPKFCRHQRRNCGRDSQDCVRSNSLPTMEVSGAKNQIIQGRYRNLTPIAVELQKNQQTSIISLHSHLQRPFISTLRHQSMRYYRKSKTQSMRYFRKSKTRCVTFYEKIETRLHSKMPITAKPGKTSHTTLNGNAK